MLNPDGVVMLSLENNRRMSFDEWYEQLPDRPIMVVQPKIDGISVGLRYVDGELKEAQTRKGRCAFDLVQLVPSIPKHIKTKVEGIVEIHGELWGIPDGDSDHRTPQSPRRLLLASSALVALACCSVPTGSLAHCRREPQHGGLA